MFIKHMVCDHLTTASDHFLEQRELIVFVFTHFLATYFSLS
jgi:hypothetical protein